MSYNRPQRIKSIFVSSIDSASRNIGNITVYVSDKITNKDTKDPTFIL